MACHCACCGVTLRMKHGIKASSMLHMRVRRMHEQANEVSWHADIKLMPCFLLMQQCMLPFTLVVGQTS